MKKDDLQKLLLDYQNLPEYMDRVLFDVNQISAFGDRPIHIAAVRGSIDELNILYENGADLNAKGEYNYTPLLFATEQGHIEAVKWLLKKGVDITATDNKDCTALDIARLLENEELIKILS